ncbi:MAG: hypothetical protein ACRDRX_13105 [Pseudonocardiaceae bacterium]
MSKPFTGRPNSHIQCPFDSLDLPCGIALYDVGLRSNLAARQPSV